MNTLNGIFGSLTRASEARSCRLSSWDQGGRNQDYWVIPAGETVTLGDIEGPGCLTHIWMTSSCRRIVAPGLIDPVGNGASAPVNEIHPALGLVWDAYDPGYYRKALLRMTWDGQESPSVLAPLGDFFCIGNGMPGNFSSLPFNVSAKPEEARKFGGAASVSCYMPMPFNTRAIVEIVNENDVPFILYFHLDYEIYRKPLPPETVFFHASWRRELPCDGWGPDLQVNTPEVNSVANLSGEGNYVVLDASGRGHYVGCNLSVIHFQGSWWGEGDDMIFIDGEKQASIMGTGSEDYFNHAWGMQRNAYPFYGSIIHESEVPGCQVSYRFHIADPVRFTKSIKVTLEHGHANHLSDDWSSTAYWYQTLPAAPLTIQPVQERIPLYSSLPPVAPREPREPLSAEMKKAIADTRERSGPYRSAREEIVRSKEAKARRESKANTELAARNRKALD